MNCVDRFIVDCPSWAEFRARIAALTEKEKGDLFERVMQVYLQTEPEYQASLTNIWLLPEAPARVLAEIGLPRRDKGVDLIARHRDGTYWLIQAKDRTDEDKALGWRALSTFNALRNAAACGKISLAIVAHTTARPVGDRDLMERIGKVVEIGLDRLRKADWSMIHASIIADAPVRPEPKTPTGRFAWQQPVIGKAVEHFIAGGNARGRMQLPCGTGKSLIAYFVANALNANTIVVAVPSLNLIKQSVDVWLREEVAREHMADWLCVASDDTVGIVDDIADERADTGLPTTTDVDEIADWLRRPGARKIVFTTYHSSPKLAEAASLVGVEFDLIVLDEAHRTAGARDREFVTLLHDEKIEACRRLFMTATERKITTERKINGDGDVLFSMDDNAADYGARFYTMTFKEAIKRDIITDYRIVSYVVTDKEVEELVRNNRLLDLGRTGQEAVDARDVASAIAVKRVMKEYGVKHPLVFARSIRASKDARDRQELLNSIAFGPFAENFHVDSTMSAAERERSLDEFIEAPVGTMFNARCLTEGVDVPGVDGVIFAAPKQSVVDIVQAAGRALRKAKGKEYGYIIIPIIVPEGKTFIDFAETTEYRTIAKIINALSTQDERIVEKLRAKYYGPTTKGGRGRGGRLIKIGGNLPVGFGISVDAFAETITTDVWRAVARGNFLPFAEARAFARSLGLKSRAEWKAYCQWTDRPLDIPTNPNVVYAQEGWTGMGDWLGTGTVATHLRQYRPFVEARFCVHSLNLKSQSEGDAFARSDEKPLDIPKAPHMVYRDYGWSSWGDWLGTGTIATYNVKYQPFERARAFVRSLGLKSRAEWWVFARSPNRPPDIPIKPERTYAKSGWAGMGDWLGTGRIAPSMRAFRPFEEARAVARSLRMNSAQAWRLYCTSGQCPADIPTNPHRQYANDGWISWADWLGTGTIATNQRQYRPFKEARSFVHSLGLKSANEWQAYVKSGELPPDIPAGANRTYAKRGWSNWGDWLGY